MPECLHLFAVSHDPPSTARRRGSETISTCCQSAPRRTARLNFILGGPRPLRKTEGGDYAVRELTGDCAGIVLAPLAARRAVLLLVASPGVPCPEVPDDHARETLMHCSPKPSMNTGELTLRL